MSNMISPEKLDWAKGNGLLPAIIQHAEHGQVLMLGYMNQESLMHTLNSGHVTFFSRSKQRLWTKGETSGHHLSFVSAQADCDQDAILIQAMPKGNTCHLDRPSCFADAPKPFLFALGDVIAQRKENPSEQSYTSKLFQSGVKRMAQKVGEEGVETALAAVVGDNNELLNESADLLFHLLVLLKQRGVSLNDAQKKLKQRHKDQSAL